MGSSEHSASHSSLNDQKDTETLVRRFFRKRHFTRSSSRRKGPKYVNDKTENTVGNRARSRLHFMRPASAVRLCKRLDFQECPQNDMSSCEDMSSSCCGHGTRGIESIASVRPLNYFPVPFDTQRFRFNFAARSAQLSRPVDAWTQRRQTQRHRSRLPIAVRQAVVSRAVSERIERDGILLALSNSHL